ncbi:MAG: HEAT repeat domain-containing protein, partial [Candidatus Micrarchaeota archaeon]
GLVQSYAPFYNVAPLPIMTSIAIGDTEFFSSMMKIKDYVTDSCTACIDALGILAAESSLKIIMLFSEADDHFVRMSVARALGSFKGKEVIETLVRMMNDESFGVQKYAVESLERIGDPSAVDEIIKATQRGKLFSVREGITAANNVGEKCLSTQEERDKFRKVSEKIADNIYGKIMEHNWFKRRGIERSINESRKELSKMLR